MLRTLTLTLILPITIITISFFSGRDNRTTFMGGTIKSGNVKSPPEGK